MFIIGSNPSLLAGPSNGDEGTSNNRPPSEQLYESASIIYGPVGYLGDGGKPSWFQNGKMKGCIARVLLPVLLCQYHN